MKNLINSKLSRRWIMVIKEQLIREIEGLSDELIEEVYDFVAFLRKRREEKARWGDFALSTGAFDFWNDPEEVEYYTEDLENS